MQFANRLYYAFKRNGWMLNPFSAFGCPKEVRLDRPVFLLGTQGGGLTLVSRMLRRNPNVISITGNHRYWAGADEMQNVASVLLPPHLTGIKRRDRERSGYPKAKEWLYATDEFLPSYRGLSRHADAAMKQRFECIMKSAIHRYADDAHTARFVDKSQLFTVKVALVNELLSECSPRFVLITRNPYAVCVSRARSTPSLRGLSERLPLEGRIELAAQHWSNSMRCATDDAEKVDNFLVLRFEDVLERPKEALLKLCDFVELDFSGNMIPAAGDEVPFGCMRRDRWYPLRSSINEKHLRSISREQIDIVARHCAGFAKEFGYEKPA